MVIGGDAMLSNDKNHLLSVCCHSVIEYSPQILENNVPFRPWPSFLAVKEGEYRYYSAGKEIVVKEGDVLFLPKGSVYNYSIFSKKTTTFQVTFDIYPDEVNSMLPEKLTILDKKSSSQIISLFPKLLKAFRSNTSFTPFSLSSLIFQFLSIMTKQFEPSLYSNQITPAIKYLEQNFNSTFPISTLSKLCNLSPSHLRRLFVQETGMSPLKFKNKLRSEEACRLLELGEYNIAEISEIMDFDTPYSFSKFFKSEMGISPSKYAISHKKNVIFSLPTIIRYQLF